jgi:hypothetical protein
LGLWKDGWRPIFMHFPGVPSVGGAYFFDHPVLALNLNTGAILALFAGGVAMGGAGFVRADERIHRVAEIGAGLAILYFSLLDAIFYEEGSLALLLTLAIVALSGSARIETGRRALTALVAWALGMKGFVALCVPAAAAVPLAHRGWMAMVFLAALGLVWSRTRGAALGVLGVFALFRLLAGGDLALYLWILFTLTLWLPEDWPARACARVAALRPRTT